jgi:hypothetical protein
VAEVLGVPGAVDDRAGDRVDLLAQRPGPDGGERLGLRAQDEVEDLAVLRVELAGGERPRAVRRVAVELRAPVDRDERPRRDLDVARHGVRQRAVRPGGDDRRERRPLRPAAAHGELEVERDRLLGPADDPRLEHLLQRRVGQLRRGADPGDLLGRLDQPQLLDDPARRDQLDPVADELGQARVLADGEVVVLDAEAAHAAEPLGHLGEQVGGDLGLAPRAVDLLGRLGQVAEVGEEALDLGPDDRGGVRPGEPGQPAHVDQVADQQRVELALGDDRRRPVAAARSRIAAFSASSASP